MWGYRCRSCSGYVALGVCCLVLGACAWRVGLCAWRSMRGAWRAMRGTWCIAFGAVPPKETGRFDLRQEGWQRRRRRESRPRKPVHLRAQMRTLLSPVRVRGAHPPNPTQCSLCLVLCAWCLVPGALCLVLGAWCLTFGAWCCRLVHCAQCFVHGLRRHGSHGPSLSGGPRGPPPDTTPPSASARQSPKQASDVLGGWCLVRV